MRPAQWAASATAIVLLLTSSALRAQPEEEDLSAGALENVSDDGYETIVSAGRRDEGRFESPRAVDVVTANQILEKQHATTPEALSQTPGLFMQRTNGAGGAPILRGLLGQRILLLVDGVRLNNAITRSGPNQLLNTVDPFSLTRVEIVRGPGSVVYGSDALGGVVNLIRRRASYNPHRAWDARTRGAVFFKSADFSTAGHVGAQGHMRTIGAHAAVSLKRFDDLRGGGDVGTQPFTGYTEGNAEAGIAWRSDWGSLDLQYSALRQLNAARTDRSTPIDFLRFSEQFRDLATLTYRHTPEEGFVKELRATLSFQSQREERERFRLLEDRIDRERDNAHTLGALLSVRFAVPHQELITGIDYYRDWIGSRGQRETLSTPGNIQSRRGRYVDDARYSQFAFFLTDRIDLGKLAIDLGGRATTWTASIPDDPSNQVPELETSATAIVGSAHARYLIGNGLNLTAGISQGFRAPNIDDYSATGCSGQGYDLPNPDLKPERSFTAEGGLKFDMFGLLHGQVFYAYTRLGDTIVRQTTGGRFQCGTDQNGMPVLVDATQRTNADAARIHTIEGQLTGELADFRLTAWLAWAHGTVDTASGTSEPLSRVPPLNGYLALRYQRNQARFFVEAFARWASSQSRLSARDKSDRRICPNGANGCTGTPGWFSFGLRAGYRPWRRMRVLLTAENLADQNFRWHGSGFDNPGINIGAGLEFTSR